MTALCKQIVALLFILIAFETTSRAVTSRNNSRHHKGRRRYIEHRLKIRHCADFFVRNANNTNFPDAHRRGLQILPIGYSYFNEFTDAATAAVKRIHKRCDIKICPDGAFLQGSDCVSLVKNETIRLDSSRNASFICTCDLTKPVPESYLENNFDRGLIGVIFSSYTKNWFLNTDKTPDWNTYTAEDIRAMLEVVSTKFSHISMYGIGATTLSASYKEGNADGLVPVAAANLNVRLAAAEKPPITVTVGIWVNYNHEDILTDYEILKAFDATNHANNIFPGTVTGITFSSDYVKDNSTADRIAAIMDENKMKMKSSGLKTGIRVNMCHDLLVNAHIKIEDPTMKYIFETFAHRVDYIICDYRPPSEYVFLPILEAVHEMGRDFLNIRSIITSLNSSVEVIGQTGWPSWGFNENSSPNNVSNEVEYWNYMTDWATENNFKLLMYEAFDTPWKNDLKRQNDFSAAGPVGSAGHHGWWRRFDNNSDMFSYIPKVREVELFPLFEEEEDSKEIPIVLEDAGSPTLIVLLIISLLVGAIIILVIVWRFFFKQGRTVNKQMAQLIKEFRSGCDETKYEKTVPPSSSGIDKSEYVYALRFPYDRKYELDYRRLSINKDCILGEGNFGIVFKGTVEGVAGTVALKTLNTKACVLKLKGLLSEIKIMSFVGEHPNIVNLIGACTSNLSKGEVFIATEFCELGNLENYLHVQRGNFCAQWTPAKELPITTMQHYVVTFMGADTVPYTIPRKSLNLLDMLRWAYEIANGMEHISSMNVIHADLACRNILLAADGTAKVSDFGLSRQVSYKCQYVKSNLLEELPWRWMALESLRSMIFSVESDVWSFGITLWEIFTLGLVPYPGIMLATREFLDQLEYNTYRMGAPKPSPQVVHELLRDCCLTNPADRPSFGEIRRKLSEELRERTKETNTSEA